MSLARPSAGSGRRVRYPRSTRSLTNSDAAARLSCARSASSVSRMPPIRMLPKIWKWVSRTSPYPASARGAARSSRNSRNNLTSSCPIARRSGGRSLDVAMGCEDTTDTEVSGSEVNGDSAMITPSVDFVKTDLGRLHVRTHRDRPAGCVVAQPFCRLPILGSTDRRTGARPHGLRHRRTVARQERAVPRDFTFAELSSPPNRHWTASASTEPVDWVGNAWGGHIGIRLATGSRLRTLTTIGTPVQGFNLREKLTMAWPLVEIYRFTGPSGFIMKQLFDSLLGAESIAAQPELAETIMASFRDADRKAMFHAMRSMMLKRTGIEDLLPSIKVPTLVMPVRDDITGWRPDEARQTCAAIPELPCRGGRGHRPHLAAADRQRPDPGVRHRLLEFCFSPSRRENPRNTEKVGVSRTARAEERLNR